MPKKELLQEFAKLAIELGVNPKKGQPVVIMAPVEAYEFVEMCAKAAYEYGSGPVHIEWRDNVLTRLSYENVETDVLKEVPSYMIEKMKYSIEKGVCQLSIDCPDPDLLDGIDQDKIKAVRMESLKAMQPYRYYTMNSVGQWSIIAYPNKKWAKKVFPELNEEEAMEKLWDAILYTSRVHEGKDVIKEWEKHNGEIHAHCKKLNEYDFKSLHFTNKYGTDLTVGLVENHIWAGGDEVSTSGRVFNPNIPTEEVFTMPDCHNINGTVVSTKPLNYAGQIIPEFKLTFKDGKVVEGIATENQATLDQLLNTDEGCRSLGEVALISYDSPISNSKILFYNTLFDENASCHLALGACYPTTVKGGETMSEEELYSIGGNHSMNHVDFMFGSDDMKVVGMTHDGQEIQVFDDGNFVI